DAVEDGELALRPEMHFEASHAVDDVVVDTLAVPAVAFAARLPVAFKNAAGTVGERRELGSGRTRSQETRQREYTRQKPGSPGRGATHSAPFREPALPE